MLHLFIILPQEWFTVKGRRMEYGWFVCFPPSSSWSFLKIQIVLLKTMQEVKWFGAPSHYPWHLLSYSIGSYFLLTQSEINATIMKVQISFVMYSPKYFMTCLKVTFSFFIRCQLITTPSQKMRWRGSKLTRINQFIKTSK